MKLILQQMSFVSLNTIRLGIILIACLAALSSGSAAAAAPAQWPDLSLPPARSSSDMKSASEDAALVIGIEDYMVVSDVEGAVRNADDWWKYLRQTRGIPRENVRLLRNVEGTRERILEEAAKAAECVGASGTLWFIFVGHGVASKDGEEGMLVGSDAQASALSLDARSVRQSELERIFSGSKAARIVMLVDTCFSGQATDGSVLVPGLQALVRRNQTAPGSRFIWMTAGASDQYAGPLPGAWRPAFSYLVLGALRGWGDADRDGSVTPQEAVDYASDVLDSLAVGHRQTPELSAAADVSKQALASGVSEKGPNLDEMILQGIRQEDRPSRMVAGSLPPGAILFPADQKGPRKVFFRKAPGQPGFSISWQDKTCAAPCSLEVDVGEREFTFTSDRESFTRTIDVRPSDEPYTYSGIHDVSFGSPTLRGVGIGMTVLGGAAIVTGGILTGLWASSSEVCSEGDCYGRNKGELIGGTVSLGVGAAMLATGIVLTVKARNTISTVPIYGEGRQHSAAAKSRSSTPSSGFFLSGAAIVPSSDGISAAASIRF